MRELKLEIRQKRNKWWGVRFAWKGWGPDLVLDRDYKNKSHAIRAANNLVSKLKLGPVNLFIFTSSGKLCSIVNLRGG